MNKTIRKTCYLLLIAVMALAFCGAAAVAVLPRARNRPRKTCKAL